MEKELRIMYENHDSKLDVTSQFGMNVAPPESQQADVLQKSGSGADFFPFKSGEDGDDWKKFNIALNWLMTSRDAQILSSPNLIVNVGTTASIVTGEDLPIQSSQFVSGAINTSIEFKRIGVTLNVTPELIDGDKIYLRVNPEVSQVLRYEKFFQGDIVIQNPVIAVRNIDTQLTLGDGEIVMLGGLYSSEKKVATEKPPILGEIPFLGDLLSSKTANNLRTQLLFFLKVNILRGTEEDFAFDPGKVATEVEDIGNIVQESQQIFPGREKTIIRRWSETLFGEKDTKLLFKDGEDVIIPAQGEPINIHNKHTHTPAAPDAPKPKTDAEPKAVTPEGNVRNQAIDADANREANK